MKLTQHDFSISQYIREETQKTQIFLHHTAGNSDPFGVYDWWDTNPEKIGTCVVIGGKNGKNDWIDGEVVQGFGSKYWAWHLGLKESTFDKFDLPYKSLDRTSIGIEICNWGWLTNRGGKFYNYVNKVVPSEDVIELNVPFRGYKFYHSYTDAQISAVRELLVIWKDKYGIPLTYNNDIWDVTTRALTGEPGVYTHCSVRFDKFDIYPHPKMINMLKSL